MRDQLLALMVSPAKRSESRGERERGTHSFCLDAMLDTFEDRVHNGDVVTLALVVPEPEHAPRLARLVPDDLDDPVVILLPAPLPPIRKPKHKSVIKQK